MIYFKVINSFVLRDKMHIAYKSNEIFYIVSNKRDKDSELKVCFTNGNNAGSIFSFEASTYSEFREHLRNGDLVILFKDSN